MSDKELADKLGENPNAVYYYRLKEGLKKSDAWEPEKVLEEIRELHLKQMDEHRNTLIEYIKCKVLTEEIDVALVKRRFACF